MADTNFPKRFGKYILLDRLASGGMAEVYRAKALGAEKFQRLVAIKCMLAQLNEDQQFTDMFIDEAKLASQLQHANIVQIYELGRIKDQLYIAMELVNGRDLRHIIKQAGAARLPVPVGFASYVVAKVAEALDFAHRKRAIDGAPLNLVHRDVSPQNILVSYDGEVKVVDFGIAKAEVRATRTRAGVLKGKFAYMAPEQIAGESIDHRADIFALGAVLYETITGQKLFKGESDFSTLEKVRTMVPPAIADKIATAPKEIDAVLKRALAKNAADRYPHAADLAEDLAPILIDNRSIFGAKQAKEFMQALYAEELETLQHLLRQYAKVDEDDALGEEHSTQVFESGFEKSGKSKARHHTASGWTDVGSLSQGGGFGSHLSESTHLFEGSPPQERSQTSPRARPVEDAYADEGDLPPPAPASSSRAVMVLVAASFVTLLAVLGVFAYNRFLRPRPSVQQINLGAPPVVVAPPARLPMAPPPNPAPVAPLPGPAPQSPDPRPPVVVGSGLEQPKTPPDANPEDDDKKAARPKHGYISVKATGAVTAKIFIDGKEAGYSPLVFHKVKTGKRSIKVVEEGGEGRAKTLDIVVAPNNTRKDPLKLVVSL